MDRLTMTSAAGGVALTFNLDITCQPSEARKILRLAEHLKDYEDTGLTPEDCAAYATAEAEQRVVVFESKERADRIRELAEADKDGRCVALQGKVGGTV